MHLQCILCRRLERITARLVACDLRVVLYIVNLCIDKALHLVPPPPPTAHLKYTAECALHCILHIFVRVCVLNAYYPAAVIETLDDITANLITDLHRVTAFLAFLLKLRLHHALIIHSSMYTNTKVYVCDCVALLTMVFECVSSFLRFTSLFHFWAVVLSFDERCECDSLRRGDHWLWRLSLKIVAHSLLADFHQCLRKRKRI